MLSNESGRCVFGVGPDLGLTYLAIRIAQLGSVDSHRHRYSGSRPETEPVSHRLLTWGLGLAE